MSVTAQTTGSQTLTDSATNTVSLSKVLSGSFVGTASEVGNQVLIGTSPTAIALPVSPANYVYVKNLSGSATLTVTWTPNGGASNVVCTLQPGSYVQLVEVAAGSGITALSVQASALATPIEFLLAG